MPAQRGTRLIIGDDVARFWSKTAVIGGCVVWIAAKDRDGYGKFATGPLGGQRHHRPHRWNWKR